MLMLGVSCVEGVSIKFRTSPLFVGAGAHFSYVMIFSEDHHTQVLFLPVSQK